jgi:predicted proteasome-type protease
MLDMIKQYINNITDISFNEYYQSYIMQVQDRNIESELKHLSARNTLSLYTMDQLIADTVKEVICVDSSNITAKFIQ